MESLLSPGEKLFVDHIQSVPNRIVANNIENLIYVLRKYLFINAVYQKIRLKSNTNVRATI